MIFLSFLDIKMQGQRTVREKSENGKSIRWPLSQPGPPGNAYTLHLKVIEFEIYNLKRW